MRRTTIMLTADLDTRLRLEASRRGLSVADVAREALDRGLPRAPVKGPLRFFGMGAGSPADVSEKTEEFVSKAVRRRNKTSS